MNRNWRRRRDLLIEFKVALDVGYKDGGTVRHNEVSLKQPIMYSALLLSSFLTYFMCILLVFHVCTIEIGI